MHYCKLINHSITGRPENTNGVKKDTVELVNEMNEGEHIAFWNSDESEDEYYISSDEDEDITSIIFEGDKAIFSDVNDNSMYLSAALDSLTTRDLRERHVIKYKMHNFYSIVGNIIIGNDIEEKTTTFYFPRQQKQEKVDRLTDLIDALQFNVKQMKQLTTIAAVSEPKSTFASRC